MKKAGVIYRITILAGIFSIFVALLLFFNHGDDPFVRSFGEADCITIRITNINNNENTQLVLQTSEQVERLNQLFNQYGYKKWLTMRESPSFVIQGDNIINVTFWKAENLLMDCLISGEKIVMNGTVYNINSENTEQKLLSELLDLVATF